MVASTENSSAHSKAKPNWAPAILAVVTVPGPIKAAVTNRPGPNFPLVLLITFLARCADRCMRQYSTMFCLH